MNWFGKLRIKIDILIFCPTGRAAKSGNFMIVDDLNIRFENAVRSQTMMQIDKNIFPIGCNCVPMKSNSSCCSEFCLNFSIIKRHAVISGRCVFISMSELQRKQRIRNFGCDKNIAVIRNAGAAQSVYD